MLELNIVTQPTRVTSATHPAAESNSITYREAKMSKKKNQRQGSQPESPVKTRTLMNHKKVKEHMKKKLKKRRETRRKQSLGQLLINTNSRNIKNDTV